MEHPFVLNHYLNAFELSFPMIAMGVTKIFTHILKNPKVRKSLKPLEEVDLISGKGGQEATALQLRTRAQALATLHRPQEALEVYSRLLLKIPGNLDVIREVLTVQI